MDFFLTTLIIIQSRTGQALKLKQDYRQAPS